MMIKETKEKADGYKLIHFDPTRPDFEIGTIIIRVHNLVQSRASLVRRNRLRPTKFPSREQRVVS